MLIRRFFSIALLVCIPALATAQRTTRGTPREDWDRLGRENRASAAAPVSRKDVEEIEPIGYLMAKRKSLKLTDVQLAQLKTLAGTAQSRDEPLLRDVDSLKSAMRPSGPMNDELRLRMQATRQELMRVVGALRINYLASATAALPILDEVQRAPAEALLQKQRDEADAMLQEKLSGGRPSGPPPNGSGGSPRGRPPS